MTAADHLATARRQLDGADRRLATGLPRDTKDADGCLAGLIAEAAKARLQIAYDRGRDDERADHETQASLDRHVRVMRGRDAITEVLVVGLSISREEARSRAGNVAMVLGHAQPEDDVVEGISAALGHPRWPAVALRVLAAWVCSANAPEAASPDELASADVDAEGPCRAGDESRCPEHSEIQVPEPCPACGAVGTHREACTEVEHHRSELEEECARTVYADEQDHADRCPLRRTPDTTPPPAPVSPTEADLVRLGALCTQASEHVRSERAGDAR